MSVLKKARRIRSRLLINAIFQIIAAAGLAAAALSVRSAPMILLITFALAVGVGYLAKRTLDRRAKYGPQDKAERVLLGLCPELEAHGFGIARRGRLPEGCRDFLVVYTEAGDLAFVIGLAGMWPTRASVEGPQGVATELTSYGIPHVPVVLAAFMDGLLEQEVFGVLAVTPQRLIGALEDVVEEFHAARNASLKAPPIPYSQIQHKQADPDFENAFGEGTQQTYREEAETW